MTKGLAVFVAEAGRTYFGSRFQRTRSIASLCDLVQNIRTVGCVMGVFLCLESDRKQ